tara:strand:+ start:1250 stop:1720 length:471 start_codon:yes stop_codon:yes gene_type:complete
MIKIFRVIIIPFFLFFLTNCSYQPVLKIQNFKYSINIDQIDGDEKVNKVLKDNFKKLENTKYKIYNLGISTETFKTIISKDSKGDPEIFEMAIIANFKVLSDGKILINKEIKRKNTYDNIADKFQLERDEDEIIENLSKIIFEYITLSISRINNDN